jgi:hypothetical protein
MLGHSVAQVVQTLVYKTESRGSWNLWNFLLTYSFRPRYGPVFDSASNRNEYQEYFLELQLADAWSKCLEI